jgi:hypothetical protein
MEFARQLLSNSLEQIRVVLHQLNFLWGFIAGIAGKVIYDKLAEPRIAMASSTSSFLLNGCDLDPTVLRQAAGPNLQADVLAYRVKVTNKQKHLLNAPARNCVAWLDIDGASESYQLCWVGSKESVTINVGDSRDIDVCGLVLAWGIVVAPLESGYGFPKPRRIGGAGIAIRGRLRVTSENAKFDGKKVTIDVEPNKMYLKILLE